MWEGRRAVDIFSASGMNGGGAGNNIPRVGVLLMRGAFGEFQLVSMYSWV